MKFGVIDPKARTVAVIEADDGREAYARAGLEPGAVDYGLLVRNEDRSGVGYVVYEFAFFIPAERQHYFAIGPRAIAGAAVIYAFDEAGVTVDLAPAMIEAIGVPTWFTSMAELETAIAAGAIIRPEIKLNGEVVWSWPNAAPPEFRGKVKP